MTWSRSRDRLLEQPQPAGAIQLLVGRIPCERVATLNDPVPDHAMKRGLPVGARPRQLDEMPNVIRRQVRSEIDDERAGRRVNDGLFVRHLRHAQQGPERNRGLLFQEQNNQQQG